MGLSLNLNKIEMKTLNDFKQKLAVNYGVEHWQELTVYEQLVVTNEAAERYAEYRAKEAREEGVNQTGTSFFLKGQQEGYKQGWNDALQWASKVIDGWPSRIITISEQQEEILKGLK